MKLIKILDKKYSDEKLAELLDDVKDFNYYELNVEEIAELIKPVIENTDYSYGGITGVKYTSIELGREKYFDNIVFPTFELGFILTTGYDSKIRLVVQIYPFGCSNVRLPKGREVISSDLLRKKITVEFIKFMKAKYGKGYTKICKRFLGSEKSSYIKAMQTNIDDLQKQIDGYKRRIKEAEEMYDENTLGLN